MKPITNQAYIVNQIHERTFQAQLCKTDSTVSCYLSHELFYRNIQPLVGDLVKLEYNFVLRRAKRRVHNIILIVYSKKKQDKLKRVTMRVKKGLQTLKSLNHYYNSWTIYDFFGSKWDRILYSSLGVKTI